MFDLFKSYIKIVLIWYSIIYLDKFTNLFNLQLFAREMSAQLVQIGHDCKLVRHSQEVHVTRLNDTWYTQGFRCIEGNATIADNIVGAQLGHVTEKYGEFRIKLDPLKSCDKQNLLTSDVA